MVISRTICDHSAGSAYCPACCADRAGIPLDQPVPAEIVSEFRANKRRREAS